MRVKPTWKHMGIGLLACCVLEIVEVSITQALKLTLFLQICRGKRVISFFVCLVRRYDLFDVANVGKKCIGLQAWEKIIVFAPKTKTKTKYRKKQKQNTSKNKNSLANSFIISNLYGIMQIGQHRNWRRCFSYNHREDL